MWHVGKDDSGKSDYLNFSCLYALFANFKATNDVALWLGKIRIATQ